MRLVTYTEVEAFDGRQADVTYHVPSNIDLTDLTEADIADLAIKVTWEYTDGTEEVIDTEYDMS